MSRVLWLMLFLCLLLVACANQHKVAELTEVANPQPESVAVDLARPGAAFVVSDLEVPESFQYDANSKKYFISNLVGVMKNEDKAYISRLNEQGEMDIRQFIIDLRTPAGIAFWQNYLFVCDGATLKAFVPTTAQKVFTCSLAPFGAKFLNDVVAAADCLYVSDTFANTIFRVVPDLHAPADSDIKIFCRDPSLNEPNGIAIDPLSKSLTVVSWQSGTVFTVDAAGNLTRRWSKSFVNPDGIAFDQAGNLYLSSFAEGNIYRITPQGEATVVVDKLASPADISITPDGKLLLIPCFKGNMAVATKIAARR